jgi:hypothetical protein
VCTQLPFLSQASKYHNTITSYLRVISPTPPNNYPCKFFKFTCKWHFFPVGSRWLNNLKKPRIGNGVLYLEIKLVFPSFSWASSTTVHHPSLGTPISCCRMTINLLILNATSNNKSCWSWWHGNPLFRSSIPHIIHTSWIFLAMVISLLVLAQFWAIMGIVTMLQIPWPNLSQNMYGFYIAMCIKGHFTHETEGPWPLHSKISHWLKMLRPSKFTSCEEVKAQGLKESLMDGKVYMDSTWQIV